LRREPRTDRTRPCAEESRVLKSVSAPDRPTVGREPARILHRASAGGHIGGRDHAAHRAYSSSKHRRSGQSAQSSLSHPRCDRPGQIFAVDAAEELILAVYAVDGSLAS